MADDEVMDELKTVRTIRGTEARTVAKWEKDGWEVVSQAPGKLQSEIMLRRAKPKSGTLWRVLGAAAVAIVLSTVITIGAINEKNAPTAELTADVSEPSTAPEEAEPEDAEPEETASEDAEPAAPEVAVLTAENSPELAAILALGDYCDASIADFAKAHEARPFPSAAISERWAPTETTTRATTSSSALATSTRMCRLVRRSSSVT